MTTEINFPKHGSTLRPRQPNLGWRYWTFMAIVMPCALIAVVGLVTAVGIAPFLLISKQNVYYVGVGCVLILGPLSLVWIAIRSRPKRGQ